MSMTMVTAAGSGVAQGVLWSAAAEDWAAPPSPARAAARRSGALSSSSDDGLAAAPMSTTARSNRAARAAVCVELGRAAEALHGHEHDERVGEDPERHHERLALLDAEGLEDQQRDEERDREHQRERRARQAAERRFHGNVLHPASSPSSP